MVNSCKTLRPPKRVTYGSQSLVKPLKWSTKGTTYGHTLGPFYGPKILLNQYERSGMIQQNYLLKSGFGSLHSLHLKICPQNLSPNSKLSRVRTLQNHLCKYVDALVGLNVKYSKNSGDPISKPSLHRTIVRRLIYLITTELGISNTVQVGNQFMSDAHLLHRSDILRIIRYPKGTSSL